MSHKDWVGNAGIRNCNVRRSDAEPNDYYATEPRAVELLLEHEHFAEHIWEPAYGHKVFSSDLIDRGYGHSGLDFLNCPPDEFDGDIITNPPYKYAKEFVEKALEQVADGAKVAMFLKLTFLEGQGRRELFQKTPPITVYVASGRLQCGKNGCFAGTSMVAYAWYIWQKGYRGPTTIKWIN